MNFDGSTTLALAGACPYCSSNSVQVYHTGKCPKVKSIEYYPDGSIKKVEFNE
jgi:hypothetical protein